MSLFSTIRNCIPANKFLPPRLDDSQMLCRRKLLDEILVGRGKHRRILFIEAQAGQGKTTFAVQLLAREKAPFAWYQVGREDGDPVLFLTALLVCLMEALPGFHSPLLQAMIPKGEIFPSDLSRYIDILIKDLDGFLQTEFWLVLDDLHGVEEADASIGLLEYFLRQAPAGMRFLLTSRRPLRKDFPALASGRELYRLTGDHLAFSRVEVAELFHGVLQVPLSGARLQHLHKATEGWAMGLMLAAYALERGAKKPFHTGGDSLGYLGEQVLAEIPRELRRTLLKLSWLQTIPLPLAGKFAEVADIENQLLLLVEKNCFVCRMDAEGTIFRFHHLFQDALRRLSRKELEAAEIAGILREAAEWCLARRQLEYALEYLLAAEDYAAIDRFLENEGMPLLALGRVFLLASIVQRIPAETVRGFGWLCFFAGVVNAEVNPPAGLAPLRESCARFNATGNRKGELLAHSHLIYYHSFLDCDFTAIAAHLAPAETLYGQLHEGLEDSLKIHVLYCLSVGFSFLHADTAHNDKFALTALALADKYGLDNFIAMIRSINGIAHQFAGDWGGLIRQMEAAFPLLHSERIGAISKLNLYGFPLNYLAGRGDLGNFLRFEQSVQQGLPPGLYARSLMAPFVQLFKIDLLLGAGRLQEARELSAASLMLYPQSAASSHLKSQFLHYHSLLMALFGEGREAMAAAEESLLLRQAVGGKIFVLLNHYIAGAAFAQFGKIGEAEEQFGKALAISVEIGEEFLRSGIYAHRSAMYLRQGEGERASEDLALLLQQMRRNEHDYFFAWVPQVMQPLLEKAVREGNESDFARQLAGRRLGLAILDDGVSMPLLEIRTFGGLALAAGGETILRGEELTRTQRDLLAHLIVAPWQKCRQERIQDELWPEAMPAKARSNLDTLLLRLRKALEKGGRLTNREIRQYLSLQKGILHLQGCRIDALEFLRQARKGLAHFRRKEYWQAGHAFGAAHQLWQGPFLPHSPGSDAVRDFRNTLDILLSEVSLKWCELLLLTEPVEQAVAVLRKALRHDRMNDAIVRKLYDAHIREKNPREARELLRRYEEDLRREEYAETEIGEILAGVVSPH